MPESETRLPPHTTADLLRRDAVHHSGLFQPADAFVRGEDVWIFDADGRRYLDCMAGIAVASIGHANPRLVEAIARQADRIIIGPQNLASDVRTELMEALFAQVPDPLQRVFFASSGTESTEAALKWARMATGRRRFVAAERGFAGRTMGSLAVTAKAAYREPFEVPAATFVPYGDADALLGTVDEDTAAIVLEPIQGEGGIHVAPPGYLAAAREAADRHGALLILDEIQSGVGRSGRFLASQHDGVVGDLVTLAKGLGGGVPIGAVLMTEEVARAMPAGGHGTTFGGNPLAAAAALAVLREIEERDLIDNAGRVGATFMERLRGLESGHIREVRGRGLMIGVAVHGEAAAVIAALKEQGVLTIQAAGETIRFLPPLTFTDEHAAAATDALARALESLD